MDRLFFEKPILIYMPCYNCERSIASTIGAIPGEFWDKIECLVLDNHSNDRTPDIVLELIKERRYPFKITLVRTKKNIGYAGSQKLAYSLAVGSRAVSHVVMLHGDGQYPPVLLHELISHAGEGYAIVNAYRSKSDYPGLEETPVITYHVIKILSKIESMITGYNQKEWHSGFVMYKREFLEKIPLGYLSKIRHIDGEFLICAGILGEKTLAVPAYKKYKNYRAFCGPERWKYVFDVFRVIGKYKRKYYHDILLKNKPSGNAVNFEFDVL